MMFRYIYKILHSKKIHKFNGSQLWIHESTDIYSCHIHDNVHLIFLIRRASSYINIYIVECTHIGEIVFEDISNVLFSTIITEASDVEKCKRMFGKVGDYKRVDCG